MLDVPRFKSFADLESFLTGLDPFHAQLGLQRIDRVLRAFGLCRPRAMVVQVIGTNAKGSTSCLLESVARAHGLRTGLFTSPHFVSIRERVLVNNRPVGQGQWLQAANDLAFSAQGLTYFEWLTALGCYLFDLRQAELIILEAGLGGANDATSAVAADLIVFTPIGLDHQAVLGPGLEEIVRDKAGAMRPGVPCVSALQAEQVAGHLRRRAQAIGSGLEFVSRPKGQRIRLRLPGDHQGENAALSDLAWEKCALALGLGLDLERVARGLSRAWLPGRLQWVELQSVPVLLDGAHNPPALSRVIEYCQGLQTPPRQLIFSCLADKLNAELLSLALSLDWDRVWVPGLDVGRRGVSAQKLARSLGGRPVSDLSRALELALAAEKGVLVCGSLYLLAEFFRLWPGFLADKLASSKE